MSSDIVPVASRMGFAPDLIRDGENGFLFDLDASLDEVEALLRKALDFDAPVRDTVKHLTWERFARSIIESLA